MQEMLLRINENRAVGGETETEGRKDEEGSAAMSE